MGGLGAPNVLFCKPSVMRAEEESREMEAGGEESRRNPEGLYS